ncbi:MAG: protein kinase [Pirellulaceae bacterium]
MSQNCLSADDLLVLVQGLEEASDFHKDHLAECEYCQQRLLESVGADDFTLHAGSSVAFSGQLPTHLHSAMCRLGELRSDIASTMTQPREDSFRQGDIVGNYCIHRKLGQGGFAEVYLAKDRVLQRLVALKLPYAERLGRGSARERFLKEARSVAMLSHPNIVPIYEIGSEGDQPFIAAEYCEGENLGDYLARHQAGVPSREAARIVESIAEAIQYSHSRGILHRDLKPSNIIVEKVANSDSRDSSTKGIQPRLLDFGLAKQIEGDADLSVHGEIVGTPAYMSPEQAAGKGNVGTASDIFSLGTILYSLLVGKNPFQRTEPLATMRAVEEVDLSVGRQAFTKLPRDLQAIVETCLQREPKQRYQSAHELAEDLRAWIAMRPVKARRASSVERLIRWSQRQPVAAISLCAALAALMLGISLTTWKWREASHNLEVAKTASAQAETNLEKANQALVQEAQARERAEKIARFLGKTYRKPKPSLDGPEVKVVDLLQRAETEISDEFAADLLTRTALLQQIGNAYVGLGMLQEAIRVLEHVREQFAGTELNSSDEAIALLEDLGVAYNNLGSFDKSLEITEESYNLSVALHGEQSKPAMRAKAGSAETLISMGRRKEALALLEETIPFFEAYKESEEDVSDLLGMREALGICLTAEGRLDEAIAILRDVCQELETRYTPDHPDTLLAKNYLANALMQADQLEDALGLRLELYETTERVMGPDNDQTLMTLNNLAATYNISGQPQKSIDTYTKLLEKMVIKYDTESPIYFVSLRNLASIRRELGEFEAALPDYETCYVGFRETLGPSHVRSVRTASELASIYEAQGNWPKASETWATLAKESADRLASALAMLRSGVADIYLGELKSGLEEFSASLAVVDSANSLEGDRSQSVRTARQRVIMALFAQREFELAAPYALQLAQLTREIDATDFDRLLSDLVLAVLAMNQAYPAESAEALCSSALAKQIDAGSLKFPQSVWLESCLVQLLSDHETRSDRQALEPATKRLLEAAQLRVRAAK